MTATVLSVVLTTLSSLNLCESGQASNWVVRKSLGRSLLALGSEVAAALVWLEVALCTILVLQPGRGR